MVHLYQSIRSPGPGGFRRLHKYHIWYFGPHFSNIGYWGCPSEINYTMLGYSIEKKVKMILPLSSKNYIILWEKLKIIWENPNVPDKLHPDFSGEGKGE